MYFSITPMGNMGNRLLEYMAALAVALYIPEAVTYNCHLPEIGLTFDSDRHEHMLADQENSLIIHDTDLTAPAKTADNIIASGKKNIVFRGYFQRHDLYAEPEFYRDLLFKKQPLDIEPFSDDDIVINIRAGEILAGGVYWYPLVPVNFYQMLVKTTGRRPVFLGQIQDCAYIRAIQAAFPEARFIPSGGPLADFNRLLHAKHLCITVSTFSWLAAWLSEAAEIHYPLLGFLHPFCLPNRAHGLGGIDLTPLGDPRYRYHLFPILLASAEADYLKFTQSLNPVTEAISDDCVRHISHKAREQYSDIDIASHESYLRRYPDAAWSISRGQCVSVAQHHEKIGKLHGYDLYGLPPRPRAKNIALGKPATQSSVCAWSVGKTPETDAAGAVDGTIDGKYSFHTDVENHPWWQVDLSKSLEISEIWIFNRIDNQVVSHRANSLAIEISEMEDEYFEAFRYESDAPFGGADGKPLIFKPAQPIRGRFVRVKLLKRDFLHLEQVEVYGTTPP